MYICIYMTWHQHGGSQNGNIIDNCVVDLVLLVVGGKP